MATSSGLFKKFGRGQCSSIYLLVLTMSLLIHKSTSLSNLRMDCKDACSTNDQMFSRSPDRKLEVSVAGTYSREGMARRNFLVTVAATSLFLSNTESTYAQELDLPTGTIAAATSTVEAAPIDWNSVYQKASKKALGGGKAGASAAVVQVLSLMWLRTSMNRQYRYGGDLRSSLQALWEEGGIGRLYQGLPFALIQGPLTRFGDTAANVGILALLESTPETQALPLPIKTAIGSISAGTWRIFLMPIDASKTAMQGMFNCTQNEDLCVFSMYLKLCPNSRRG